MPIERQLLDLGELFNCSALSTFTQNRPVEWVASALDLSAQATIGRRRLPSDQVPWLVFGMALFRGEPVDEVARRLDICAQGLASDQLRQKVGSPQPASDWHPVLLRDCFVRWKSLGCERDESDDWSGLQVFAVDGALLRTPG